jgi:hypothetical protein
MEIECNQSMVIQYINERIICVVCHEIVNEPLSCPTCTMIICKSCEIQYSQYNQKCPNCKNLITFVPNSFVKYLVNFYTINCPDCNKKYTHEEYYKTHTNSCKEKMISCELCNTFYKRKDFHFCDYLKCDFCDNITGSENYINHLQDNCLFYPYKCNKCNDLINKNISEKHIQTYCKKVEVLCIYCKNYFYRSELSSHYQICELFEKQCMICNEFYKKKDNHNCVFTICSLCLEPYEKINKIIHLNNDCQEINISCNICNKYVKKKKFIEHIYENHTVKF